MATPVWSRPTPMGAYEFGFDDGTTATLPPTPYAREMDAKLPSSPEEASGLGAAVRGSDPMAGATASLEDVAKSALSGQGPTSPPPSAFGEGLTVASDGGPPTPQPTGDIKVAPAPGLQPDTVAGAVEALRAGAPTKGGGRFKSAADRALDAEVTARRYGMTTLPTMTVDSAPTGYATNPNEGRGAQPPVPRAQYHTVKGGPRTAQWNYQYRDVPKPALEAADQAMALTDLANLEEAEHDQNAWKREVEQQKATDEAVRYEQERIRKAQEARLAEAKAEQEKLAKEVEEIGNTKIDPDQWWESKSTGTRIGLALAAGAGAVGAALAGGPNTALQIIDGQIKRDIDAQKANLANRKSTVKDKNNLYGRMLERFGNEHQAELAAMAAYQQQVARAAARRALETKDPMRSDRLKRMEADYQARYAATINELYGRNVSEAVVNVPDRTVQIGGARPVKEDKAGAKAYGADRARYGVDVAMSRTADMRDLVAKYPDGDIPGLTPFDLWRAEKFGMNALGEEARQNYQVGARYLDGVARVRTGAAMTGDEKPSMQREFFGNGDSTDVRRGIEGVHNEVKAREENLQRTHGEDAVRTFWGRGAGGTPDSRNPDVGFRGAGK